jgi:hypothetical protein
MDEKRQIQQELFEEFTGAEKKKAPKGFFKVSLNLSQSVQ